MTESIGAALRKRREQRQLTLQQVSEATRIRVHALQALENDDISAMPSAAQARGFHAHLRHVPGVGPRSLDPAFRPPGDRRCSGCTHQECQPLLQRRLLRRPLRRRLTPGRRRPAYSPICVTASLAGSETDPRSPKLTNQLSRDLSRKPTVKKKPSASPARSPSRAPSPRVSWAAQEADLSAPTELSSSSEVQIDRAAAATDAQPPGSVLETVHSRLATLFAGLRASVPPPDADDDGAIEDDEPEESARFANAVDFNPLPREQEAETLSSDEIFAEIGRELRARREMLSLTYEEIERHTHVRISFLEALENGALDGLPSTVQARGILANYAAFIDLNPEAILLRFAEGIQARHREQRPHWPQRTRSPMTVHSNLPPLRAFIASDLLFGGGAAIMLILFAVWGINRVVTLRSAQAEQGGALSIPEALAQAAIPTIPSEITLIPAVDTQLVPTLEATTQEAPTSIDPSITVQVRLSATERTYLRVLVDDQPAFEGRTEPGKDYYYQAARQIEVLAGNAAALRVTHNGTDRGTLGGYGQVVDQLYTSRGVFTPTPTTPPTATASATPTATLRATPTLATFTPTPRTGE